MNFRLPAFVWRAWEAFVEWGNVPVYERHPIDIVRLDLIMVIGFIVTVTYYWLVYGWQWALKGGVLYVVLATIALMTRR